MFQAKCVYKIATSIESDWTMGSSDCMTLTYDSKLNKDGAAPSLTKVGSCQDAVGLCKAKLGKLYLR